MQRYRLMTAFLAVIALIAAVVAPMISAEAPRGVSTRQELKPEVARPNGVELEATNLVEGVHYPLVLEFGEGFRGIPTFEEGVEYVVDVNRTSGPAGVRGNIYDAQGYVKFNAYLADFPYTFTARATGDGRIDVGHLNDVHEKIEIVLIYYRSDSPPPTMTPESPTATPTNTYTPGPTATPSNTPTATLSPTPSNTPPSTSTPACRIGLPIIWRMVINHTPIPDDEPTPTFTPIPDDEATPTIQATPSVTVYDGDSLGEGFYTAGENLGAIFDPSVEDSRALVRMKVISPEREVLHDGLVMRNRDAILIPSGSTIEVGRPSFGGRILVTAVVSLTPTAVPPPPR